MNFDILTIIIFLPGVIATILMVSTKNANISRNVAFITTVITAILVLNIYIDFQPNEKMQYIINIQWIKSYGINYYIGVDGFSLTILMMIAVLMPTAYLLLWEGRPKEYWVNLLLIQMGTTGALLSLDVVLFYFFWEVMLLPVFLIMGAYGSGNRVFTTIKVTVYTMAGSFLMFIAILYLGVAYYNEFHHWSFAYDNLMKISTLDSTTRLWLFAAFLSAFAIKIPIFPLHTWIMDTYKNAPTGAVFLLSSIMAKLGIYGIVRFMIPIFSDIYMEYTTLFIAMGLFGMIYFGIAALMQNDIKRMFAYSSASHLSFISAGMFSLNDYGVSGALYLIIAHAIASGILFLLIGLIQKETGFKTIKELGGIASGAPILTFIFAVMLFTNIGLPGTSGFVAELLIIFGIYKYSAILGIISAFTVLVGASYMLWMFQRAILQDRPKNKTKVIMRDLNKKEIFALMPWVFLVFIMGIFPEIFMYKFEPTVSNYTFHYLLDTISFGVTK